MASYLVRVELAEKANKTKPGSAEFTALHEAMADAGFKRTILADSGVSYHLPDAMYSASVTGATAETVAALVNEVATGVWTPCRCIVADGSWASHGLLKA